LAAPLSFLSRLGESGRAALAARWTTRSYERDEMIIAHDEGGRDVFFVLEGRARATLFSQSGRAVAYRDMEPGDIFGEIAAIDGRVRSASVVALEPVKTARLPLSAFREAVESEPAFTWALLEHLSDQMRRLTDRIYEFSTLVVRKRLIRELLRLAQQDADGRLLIRSTPTHSDLAARISTHREAVSREFSALSRRKLIAREKDAIVLVNVEALRELASEDD
jgi:CRP-like cAMP-binding protein